MNDSAEFAPDIHSLQTELLRSGNTLVFIDDSGTPEQPLGEHLAKDYKLHAAVVLSSDAYRNFLTKHQEFLSQHPWADEFHTVDIFQGKHGTWSGQREETRRRAFNFMAAHFSKFVERILYVNIGTEQYGEIMGHTNAIGSPHPSNIKWDSHEEGARVVLMKAIASRVGLQPRTKPLVVVEDADGSRQNCCEVMFTSEEISTTTEYFGSTRKLYRAFSLLTWQPTASTGFIAFDLT